MEKQLCAHIMEDFTATRSNQWGCITATKASISALGFNAGFDEFNLTSGNKLS